MPCRTGASARLLACALGALPSGSARAEAKSPPGDGWQVEDPLGDWGWREVGIDTREGTWMNIDVSPDGETVVFDLLGDIYRVPIEGGEAEPLRAGLAWHMQPRFSPDGQRIAFTSDRGAGDNLWVMNADGTQARQITKESFRLVNNPAWAPSGDFVVGRKHFTGRRSLGAGEMWLYHVSGGKGVQMTKRPTEQKDVNDPAFSPDGRYLYYDRDATPGRRFEYNKDAAQGIYRVERLDRRTGEIITVAGGPGGACRPTPSPDGRKLAFVRRVDGVSALFVKDLTSGEERLVHRGLERDNQEIWAIHGVYPSIAWTPNSASLVFWSGGGIQRLELDGQKLTTIPFRVRAKKRLAQAVRSKQTAAPERLEVKMLRSVVVSPTRDRVAYVALGRIWVRDLPEGEPRRLTRDEGPRFEHDPSFSRDGRRIVFATWSDRELGSVRVAPARGGRAEVITRVPGHFVEPRFDPQGERVVVRRVRGGYLRDPRYSHEPGIYLLDADGGPLEKVSASGADAHFGARADRLFLTRAKGDDTSETRTLVALDLDEREERVLFTSSSVQRYLVAPDSRWLAFRDGYHVYLTPLAETGRAVSIGPKAEGLPVARATAAAGTSLSWAGDAKALFWSLGPKLYERPLEHAFAFMAGAPEALPEPPAEGRAIGFGVAPDVPRGVVALVGAKVVTMRGDEVLEDGAVLVRDAKIAWVGPRAELELPRGAHVVNLEGKTVVPGFIDAHAHGAQGTDGIIPQHNWRMYANLAFGVTTIHDPSNITETIFAASELQRAGKIRAPRIFSTGRILYGAEGIDYKAKVENLDDARFHLERLKAVGAFSVKSYNQPRRDQRQMILTAARELGMLVVPEGGATLMHNLTMLVDGHTTIEHNLPVARLYDDVLQLWAKSEVALTPTLGVAYGGLWGERYWYQHMDVWKHPRLTRFVPRYVLEPRARRRQKAPESDYDHIAVARWLKALVDRGRLVNTGAHGQLDGLALHWEMWMFAQGGMTAHEALRAATLSPARSLGLDAELGSIESGKLADLVVLERDPLEDIRNSDSVAMVMQNGRLYDASTLDQIGPHPDAVGSHAFGTGERSLGVGRWWGGDSAHGAHVGCGCLSAH